MKQFLTGLCLCALTMSPAWAETIGTISANWEGKDRTWYVTKLDGKSDSSRQDIVAGDVVSLWGNPSDDVLAVPDDVLTLNFFAMRNPQGHVAMDPEVYYLVKGYTDAWHAGEGDDINVALTRYEKTKTSLQLGGTFHAMLQKGGESRAMDGRFEVTFNGD